jgi:hypothetical protein
MFQIHHLVSTQRWRPSTDGIRPIGRNTMTAEDGASKNHSDAC